MAILRLLPEFTFIGEAKNPQEMVAQMHTALEVEEMIEEIAAEQAARYDPGVQAWLAAAAAEDAADSKTAD